jgi:DNA-directed RNA polymerase specialized sigma24 family protein
VVRTRTSDLFPPVHLEANHEQQRDVLLLMASNDLSYGEVAEALEIPVGTARSRIS